MSNSIPESMLTDEQWVRQMAQLEDEHPSISAGGMVADLGFFKSAVPLGGILGRFVEFARRKEGLTLEELARRAGVDLAELVAIEQDAVRKPRVSTVERLANYFRLPQSPLLELAGLLNGEGAIGPAAIRFAAESESHAELSPHERAAFETFVKAIAETASN